MLPLVRYRTGDRARLLDTATVARTLSDIGERHLNLPRLPMIALAGRDSDRLPDGRPLLDIKDALYSRHDIADRLSGAFRIEHEATGCCLHMQMGAGAGNGGPELADAIDACLPKPTSGAHDRIQVWGHAEFPFGRVLDYERKFNYLDAVGKP
jgi:phenylacetate-CoA ligase